MDQINGEYFDNTLSGQHHLTIDEIRGIISGRYATFSRGRAIALLMASDAKDKHKDFELLLENEAEPWTVRYHAAICLGRINTPESKEILMRNTRIADEQVLTAIMKSLGRIGDERSLDSILDVRRRTTGFVESQAEFAAALISYRLNLPGNDLPDPAHLDYLTIPSDFQEIEILAVTDEEIRLCLQSLKNEPFGIQFAENHAYQVRYGQSIGMVLFNQHLINHEDGNMLLKRKLLLGVFAAKIQEHGSYSVAYLIFTSPAGEGRKLNIVMTSPDGKLVLGGTAELEGNYTKFLIRSVSQLGMFPVVIEGNIRDNKLEITNSKFSSTILHKNQRIGHSNLT
jgi:hypothetical protein